MIIECTLVEILVVCGRKCRNVLGHDLYYFVYFLQSSGVQKTVKMECLIHDHCYTNLGIGQSQVSPDHLIDLRHKRKAKELSASSCNDLVDGLPEGYICTNASSYQEDSNCAVSTGKRRMSLIEPPINGSSPRQRKGNKIHELLFGENDDNQYFDGVLIPDNQTVSSEEGKSITTSDFGLYINNPSTYTNVSSDDNKVFLNGSEKHALFEASMSVDSETEILEAASTLMDLARNAVIHKNDLKPLKKTKTKPEKSKRTNVLKSKSQPDVKTQKRKYTKRKGAKKDNAKETYSLWTNGNKYDEFEYYATKPLHRSQCTLSSRKSSSRRSQETKVERKGKDDAKNVDILLNEGEDQVLTATAETELTESAPKTSRKRKCQTHTYTGPKNIKTEEKSSSFKDLPSSSDTKPSPELHQHLIDTFSKPETFMKSESSELNSMSASTSDKLPLVKKEEISDIGEDVHKEKKAMDFTASQSTPSNQSLTRPIPRRGKRKSHASDEEPQNSDDEVTFAPIKFEPQANDQARVDPWGQAIPLTILLQIFQNVVESTGVAPFLAR